MILLLPPKLATVNILVNEEYRLGYYWSVLVTSMSVILVSAFHQRETKLKLFMIKQGLETNSGEITDILRVQKFNDLVIVRTIATAFALTIIIAS